MSTVFEILYQNKVSVLKEQHSHVCAKWIDPNQTIKGNGGPPLLFLWPSMVQIFILKTYNFALNVDCVDLVNEYQWGETLNYTYFSCTKAVCVYESVQIILFWGQPMMRFMHMFTLYIRKGIRWSGALLPAQI